MNGGALLAGVMATTVLLALPARIAGAQSLESMQLAQSLGNLLASEKFCDLTYNQDAIAAFIEKRVRADDMGFTGMLQLMTAGAKGELEEMSESAKTAHCAQTVRVARAYGFIK